jgi:hypothetical protein
VSEEGVGAVAVSEAVVLPGLAGRGDHEGVADNTLHLKYEPIDLRTSNLSGALLGLSDRLRAFAHGTVLYGGDELSDMAQERAQEMNATVARCAALAVMRQAYRDLVPDVPEDV